MKGQERQYEEEEEGDSSICDKSAELWTVALNRRKKDKNPLPNVNTSVSQGTANPQKHLQQLQQQHRGQIAQNKHKEVEIQLLSQQVQALLEEKQQQNTKRHLEHSSLRLSPNPQVRRATTKQQTKRKKQSHPVTEVAEQDTPLEQLSQAKIIALLKNTSEYEGFTDYYHSHAITYLHLVAQQHRKPRHREGKPVSDDDIFQHMQKLNRKEGWGLSKYHQELILAHMQHYYQHNTKSRLKSMSRSYQGKIRKEKASQKVTQAQIEQMRRHKEAELTRQLVTSTKKIQPH